MDFELDVRRWLEGLGFPAQKQEIVDYARGQGAPGFVLMSLENIPDGTYAGPESVAEQLTTTGPDISDEAA